MGGGACHEALQHDAHLSEADKGVEVTDTRAGSITCAAERQALDPRHLRNGLHRDDGGSRSSFFTPTARSSTSGFQRLAAKPPLQLAHLATPVRPLGRCPRPATSPLFDLYQI